ncbi:MAG: phage major capsid protein [Thiobacillus sp.]|nr:phage major capsid protein [Thiobacillus sp.]
MNSAQQNRIAAVAREVRMRAPMALATSYGATVSGPDGGYAVPVDFARSVLMPSVGALLPYCRELPVTQGGSIALPLDVATAYGSDGIVAAWEVEGALLTQQKPNLNLSNFILKKLIAMVPVTDELLDDSDALAAFLPIAMQTAVTRKVNDGIIAGLGAGRPLGILNSGSLITVAKDGSQGAGTIVDANIAAMLDRSLTPDSSRWVCNPSIYSKIVGLASFDSATQRLAGLPIVTTDSCPAPGTPGDLILADLDFYIVASKTPQLNGSMHIWFDQDVTAFRLSFRMDGMPMLGAPVTPPNATANKSHIITVAVRA